MKTISPDRTYIEYWQNFGTRNRIIKSHFGIRVWEDHCSAITNLAAEKPILFGDFQKLPVDLSEIAGKHIVSNVTAEHMRQHPDSDLIAVITGKKLFREALDHPA